MSDYGKRLAALETIYQADEEPPTRHFFTTERFQAKANYGNQSPEQVREDIEEVERVIAQWDALRTRRHLDVVDFAIALVRAGGATPSMYGPADAIGLAIHLAYWHWDEERRGKGYAARSNRRTREQWETLVAARLAQHGEPLMVR